MSQIIPVVPLSGEISANQELSGSMNSVDPLDGKLSTDTRASIKVIDNLESEDTKAALSANMGRVLNEKINDFEEEDPTVHDWAKAETKPNYTAGEVGAVDVNNELSFADIDNMFAAVFGGN